MAESFLSIPSHNLSDLKIVGPSHSIIKTDKTYTIKYLQLLMVL
jgi:hypothetical protein